MMLLFLTLVALEALPDDQQHHLRPDAYDKSVRSCMEALGESEQYCGCLVNGFQTFLPRDDWRRILSGLPAKNQSVITEIAMACYRAVEPR